MRARFDVKANSQDRPFEHVCPKQEIADKHRAYKPQQAGNDELGTCLKFGLGSVHPILVDGPQHGQNRGKNYL